MSSFRVNLVLDTVEPMQEEAEDRTSSARRCTHRVYLIARCPPSTERVTRGKTSRQPAESLLRRTVEQTRVQQHTTTNERDNQAGAGEEPLASRKTSTSTGISACSLKLLSEPPECVLAVHGCELRPRDLENVDGACESGIH